MLFYNTKDKTSKYSFKESIIKGIAPQMGLFFPEMIPLLTETYLKEIHRYSIQEIAFEVAKSFIGDEIDKVSLKKIVDETLNFPLPLVRVEDDVYALELFHGPTCAFKDVGARFMSRCLNYFVKGNSKPLTILVATSGDTGSAVANGFYGIDNIEVVILYPSGKVSMLQEKQLTTLGKNITALEINGTFDDCQALVKQAFMDADINSRMDLTSANSINIARLIPQSFYYFAAISQLPKNAGDVFMSVPSGNFGNLTAGLLAKSMGLGIKKFIASTNVNKIVPDYLDNGIFSPKASIQTISNAMDVGNPNNFPRILELYGSDLEAIRQDIAGFHYTDHETKQTMAHIFKKTGYVLDPHGAVGYLGLKNYMIKHHGTGIFFETAHPAKFGDVVEETIGLKVEIPESLKACLDKEKVSIALGKDFVGFKEYLMNRK
jgi:threonine synthase